METSDLSQLSEDLIGRLGSGGGLDGIMGSEFFDHQENISMDHSSMDAEDNESDDVIVLHMDIREPLSNLQKLVETKYGFQLTGYKFWLQDTQELEPNKNLVDQCVKGEGLVQINVQIRIIEQRINIVDVLKPTEEALAAEGQSKRFEHLSNEDSSMAEDENSQQTDIDSDTNFTKNAAREEGKTDDEHWVEQLNEEKRIGDENSSAESREEEKPCQDWVLDHKFKKEQIRLQIPEDPVEWTVPHVQHWFQWAIRHFELIDFKESDWTITGKELCAMTHQEFREKMPRDPGNIFWTHLQLLKECKFVSVMANITDKNTDDSVKDEQYSTKDDAGDNKEPKIMRKITNNSKSSVSNSAESSPARSTSLIQSTSSSFGSGSGNNGQMQLWQFLLEILTDREHVSIIQWVGTEGEFRLSNPEEVARLWGIKKNKPAMNYEKLSRALRYYYDGDMISKVSGKRFAYKFDCDLKLLIGYDAAELSQLVNEKPFMSESMFNQKVVDDAVESILKEEDD